MDVKQLEIRDVATFIPALAVRFTGSEGYLLRRAGYARSEHYVLLTHLGDNRTNYDPHAWGGRTLPMAHDFIIQNWESLTDGAVVDVEYLLGESPAPKVSEQVEQPV